MATKYTFSFSDTGKTAFDLHAYTANGPVSPSNGSLIPQAVAQTTTLKLYGKGMKEYGEGVEQNLIYMLENFANNIEPVNAIEGQNWYNNSTGGLFIRNGSSAWDGIILATGNVSMQAGKELLLGVDATSSLGAVTYNQLFNIHEANLNLHMTDVQNTFLDDLLIGSPQVLFAADVLQLEGINPGALGNVQVQLDDKISRAGDVMDTNADLTFNDGNIIMNSTGSPAAGGDIIMSGGTITGLPSTPTLLSEATSKDYVLSLVLSGAGGDGVLTAVDFVAYSGGSPEPAYNPTETSLEFTITFPGSPATSTITLDGISRAGHFHNASDVIFDNTFNGAYPVNVQDAIEYVDTNKANLLNPTFTGTVAINGDLTATSGGSFVGQVSAGEPIVSTDLATKNYVDVSVGAGGGGGGAAELSVTRKFEITPGTGSPPSPLAVLEHTADDHKMSITINGVKYYAHTYGIQEIQYDAGKDGDVLELGTLTGLDQSLDYEFAINVDGAGVVTVTISTGTDTTTHTALINAINAAMETGSPQLADVKFTLDAFNINREVFTSYTSGSTSSIVISDPGGSPDTYLFATDPSPTAIVSATFLSDTSSPIVPDDIEISGDVTAAFTAGKSFTIRGSSDATYGSYDGVYRVHDNGPVYNASPGTTLVPIATVADSAVNESLLSLYQPVGSPLPPAPSPSAFGDVHFTPIGGFNQVVTAIDGIDGDYAETDSAGTTIKPGALTDYVLFDVAIPNGEKIETILLS